METNVNIICQKEFEGINKRLDDHDDKFKEIDKDYDKIKDQASDMKGDIKSLIKSLQGLTDAIKYIGGPILFGIIGFFFYALQRGLLK